MKNIINTEITEDEVKNAVKNLRNGKAGSDDRIINEYIKCSIDKMLSSYVKIFNIILNSGEIPNEWLLGNIIPIYKRKGA